MIEQFIGYAILIGLGAIGYIACWFYFWRICQAKVPRNIAGFLALFGLTAPPLGMLVGYYYILFGPTKQRVHEEQAEFYRSATPEEIVELIDDNSSSSMIAVKSAWYTDRWHKFSEKEKLDWVINNRELLIEHLSIAEDAPTYVSILRKIDRLK